MEKRDENKMGEKRAKREREGTREPLTCLPPRSLLSTSRSGVPALAHH
jgi:hypothetical protein